MNRISIVKLRVPVDQDTVHQIAHECQTGAVGPGTGMASPAVLDTEVAFRAADNPMSGRLLIGGSLLRMEP